MQTDEDLALTPYRKKSKRRPPKKANHKHENADCVFFENGHHYKHLFIGSYCPVCGKIMNWLTPLDGKWRKNDSEYPHFIHSAWTEDALREFNPETRTLPFFEIKKILQREVNLEEEADESLAFDAWSARCW